MLTDGRDRLDEGYKSIPLGRIGRCGYPTTDEAGAFADSVMLEDVSFQEQIEESKA